MKKRPSDYCNGLRYLKRSNIPTPGSVFTITEIEETEKSSKFTGKSECCIRLTFDERWWFDLTGGNLDTTIQLLGDDFEKWYNKRLNLRVATFKKDGEEKSYIKVVRPPGIGLPSKNRPAPQDEAGTD